MVLPLNNLRHLVSVMLWEIKQLLLNGGCRHYTPVLRFGRGRIRL